MIPPSSLARLILGYLEEEGLQRTAQTFQQECNDAVKDPLTQHCSLKSILEEYVEIKETASPPIKDAAKVIASLWKRLDVVVAQLKYHTIPETKIPRVNVSRTKRRSICERLQIAKPVSNHMRRSLNRRVPHIPKTTGVDHKMLLARTSTDYGVGVSSVSPAQQQAGSVILMCESQNNADGPGINVSNIKPIQGNSNDQRTAQLPNTISSYLQIGNSFRRHSVGSMASQESDHSTTKTAAQSSRSRPDSLVCTCSDSCNEQTDTLTPSSECTSAPSIEVVEERSSSPFLSCATNLSNNRNVLQVDGRDHERYGMEGASDKIEMLSKSPKRKGHPPKKRNYCNPSPSKLIPMDQNPGVSQSCDNNFDLQQLFDGGNFDLEATMPLLLDTLLSTPLLQEKLAENINKVVGSTKQTETAAEVVSESSQVLSCKDDTASCHQDELQVPVDDILNLMEADPAFDALFNLLSDGIKTASPVKDSQAITTFSYSEPVSTSGVCSSAEPVSTGNGSSVLHSLSSDYDISATSMVTQSLLLLASSPSKCPTTTSTTPSLETLHVISPKEVTPEFPHKQNKVHSLNTSGINSLAASESNGPLHVRSLQFQENHPAVPFGKPKKSKPVRKKRNSTKTSNKVGAQRLKKLNRENSNGQGDKPLQRLCAKTVPGAAAEVPSSFSTIDLSAVKLLQSFASAQVETEKSNGGTSVQFLQDAAIHQQVQGFPTVCESQQNYPKQTTGLSHVQGLMPPKNLQPTVEKNTTFRSLLFDEASTTDQVTGGNILQQTVSPRQTSSVPLINQRGTRLLLPRTNVHPQVCSAPLLSALVQATPTRSCVQLLSTPQSSSLAPFVQSLSSASSASSSVLSSSSLGYVLSSAAALIPPSLPSSLSVSSSLPPFATSGYAASSSFAPHNHLCSIPPPSSSFAPLNHLSSAAASFPPSLPSSFAASHELSSSLPASTSLSVLNPRPSLQSSPSCVSSSSSSSTNVPSLFSPSLRQHDSTLPTYLNQQVDYLSSTQQHSQRKPTYSSTNPPQSTIIMDHNPSTNLQRIDQEAKKKMNQMNRTIASEKPQSSVVMATTVFQGQQVPITQDSNEPSPTSQNAEKCVSGFISGFEDFFGNNQTSRTLPKNNTFSKTLNNSSKDNDIDGVRVPRKCMRSRDNTQIEELIRSENDSNGSNVDSNSNEGDSVHAPNNKTILLSERQTSSCIEERRHGRKRPAGQDLQENKLKKSRGCKKAKKSKTKPLPKNFDVEKFLSRLHYIEK